MRRCDRRPSTSLWTLRKSKDHICRQIRISFTGGEVFTKCSQLIVCWCCLLPLHPLKRSAMGEEVWQGWWWRYMLSHNQETHKEGERKKVQEAVGVISSPIRNKDKITKVIGKFATYSLQIRTFSMFSFFSFSKIMISQLHLPQITKPWFDYVFLITWNTCGS